jgi:hypothetical protein
VSRWFRRIGAALVVLGAAWLLWVHHQTGEFRLVPAAAPPDLHEYGRLYHRGDTRPHAPTRNVQVIDHTAGGGDVLSPRVIAVHGAPQAVVPTVLWVRHDGTVWTYALSGGP